MRNFYVADHYTHVPHYHPTGPANGGMEDIKQTLKQSSLQSRDTSTIVSSLSFDMNKIRRFVEVNWIKTRHYKQENLVNHHSFNKKHFKRICQIDV